MKPEKVTSTFSGHFAPHPSRPRTTENNGQIVKKVDVTFTIPRWGGQVVTGIKDRVLLIALEDGAATGPQMQALNDFQKLAKAQWPNVKVIFQFIK